ncbi:MAG TPA: hypothetical protein VGQ29_12930 [Gemmatimonadales bacterium]|nr:hypothetical protein [Gemmatimonadales bacterium]
MLLSSRVLSRVTNAALGTQWLCLATTTLAATLLMVPIASARAQLSSNTFGGIPLWADSALRRAGLDQQFGLSSKLSPIYEVGDFDRDGLVDIAVEVKDSGGLRCGIAIVHRIDRSVHIVGAGRPLANGHDWLACGDWGIQFTQHTERYGASGPALLYISERGTLEAWLVWDGNSYVWVPAS